MDRAIIVTTISGAFVFGMVLALLGSLKLTLTKRLGIGEGLVGGLFSALNLALIPMMLFAGVLLDGLGVRGTLILGSTVTALALFGLSLRMTYRAAVASVLVAGLGAACVGTASVVLMPQAFDFGPGRVTAALNFGTMFLALGALVMPPVTDYLMRAVEFRKALGVLALACLVPALAALATPGADFGDATQAVPLGKLLANPFLLLAGLVFFFYAPLEGSISVWTTTYLTDLGFREKSAVWVLSGFWACFLVSRLFTAYLLPEGWDPWMTVLAGLLAAVVLGNLAGAPDANWRKVALGLLLLGLLLGPIFPCLVARVFKAFGDSRGTAFGEMYALGSVGSLILGPILGSRARSRNVQPTLRILVVVSLLMAAAALTLALWSSS